jgi:hypothetical protein
MQANQERPHFSPHGFRRSGLSGYNGSAAQGVPEQSSSHLTERRRKGTLEQVHERDRFGIIVPGVNIWSGSL